MMFCIERSSLRHCCRQYVSVCCKVPPHTSTSLQQPGSSRSRHSSFIAVSTVALVSPLAACAVNSVDCTLLHTARPSQCGCECYQLPGWKHDPAHRTSDTPVTVVMLVVSRRADFHSRSVCFCHSGDF